MLTTLLASAVLAAAGPADVIRTGGPSAPGDPKVAIVATSKDVAGRRFHVVGASGRTVLRGRLRKAAGTARPWRHAAMADLSRITKPGRYRVVAAGVRSRPWVVDRHARSRLIRRLLRLFAVNSDGNEPNPVFAPAHLNDAIVKGGPLDGQRIDLTGGWRDAGDNLKIALPTRPEVLGWPAVRPASASAPSSTSSRESSSPSVRPDRCWFGGCKGSSPPEAPRRPTSTRRPPVTARAGSSSSNWTRADGWRARLCA